MGAMNCDRNGCDGQYYDTITLGDRNVSGNMKYICYDCYCELRDILKALPREMSKGEATKVIRDFFHSEKPCDGATEMIDPLSLL